ncbi:uncharacterized protein LOC112157787 isoform X2 [Oryzias melastigma]|uniref:uncharacterized protein LOC112157787 isoform X2 n=1 Tax=Oryzias melastigma TaxID=30732 RepID=UPI000CF831FC|nr:uncharacterized protein LOC112157787 isoform X2 [Oryzias melastigma]
MSGKLQLLLLCGSCLCLRGAPIKLPNISLSGTTHGESTSSTAGRLPNVGETRDQLTETENWDTSGTLEPEKDVQDAQSRENEETRIDGLPGEAEPRGIPEVPTRRSTSASPQLERQKRKQSGAQENQETSSPSSADATQFWTQKQTVFSPSLMSDTPQMFTPLTGCDKGTISSSSDQFSDEGLMCRQERRRAGTATPAAAEKVDLLPEDGPTKAVSSPVAPPIEPFKVQPPAAAQITPGMNFHQRLDAMTTSGLLLSKGNHLVTGQTDSDEDTWTGSTLLPDQNPPRQTSGDDLEPVSSSSPPLLQVKTKLETEEQDEDENSEESEEEDSEEDLTERFTESPYGHIPPPPLWVQGNQGLMRSWLELIKEKAGHVSGMLVPVGIGITGALMIVGVLYSHLHERGSSVQDQAMLLVNSSEDEF